MNTNLILTAKSRAAEVLRDKRALNRARAMNGATHYENAGDTAARLLAVDLCRRMTTPAQLDRDMEAARKHDLKK